MEPTPIPNPTTYPSGVRPPLTADNDLDHSGLIVVLTSFYLVLTLAAVSARVFSLYRKRLVQADDYVFAVLVVVAFAQAAVVLLQVHYGWGTSTGLGPVGGMMWGRMLKTGYAADILAIIALGLSKISTCLFYEALFSQLRRGFIRALLGGSIIWTFVSILLVAIRCSGRPWADITDHCDGLFPRWQAITALDITTEALMVIYSAWAIRHVRIPFKKQVMVFLALGCRIVLIPPSALRLHYTSAQYTSPTPILSGAYTTTTTEIYLSLSIICLVTSSMKFILAVYEDKNGFSYTDRSGSARGSTFKSKTAISSDSSGGKSLGRLSFGRGRGISVGSIGDKVRLVRDRTAKEDEVDGEGGGPSGTGSGLRILREVQWSVEGEEIELDENVPRPVVPTRPIYQSLRY